MKMKSNDFFTYLAPTAIQVRLEGSPMFVSVRLAQNLLETGGVIHPWYNLGGIKVGSGKPNEWWDGSSVRKGTWEVINGQRIDTSANFRAYKSVYHFYKDQDLLFKNSRYARVRSASTPEQQAEMLQASGYATDPQYANKIRSIMRTYNLEIYDKEAEQAMERIAELEQQVAELAKHNAELQSRLQQLESAHKMDVPEWARKAVDAAVKAGFIDTPEGGSIDFYRFLTVMYRADIFTSKEG